MKLPFNISISRNDNSSATKEASNSRVIKEVLAPIVVDSMETKTSIDEVLGRLHAMYDTLSGVSVTPETCMQSPTVQAIVQAISKRISTLPIQVLRKSTNSKGQEIREKLPNHPVAKLLQYPNAWQTRTTFLLDATSTLIRYGSFVSFKRRGSTGPIRSLVPIRPSEFQLYQDNEFNTTARLYRNGGLVEYDVGKFLYVRGTARDFLNGDSPVNDIRESIALEIAAEKFGGTFFGNGAMPFLVFRFMQGIKGFKSTEDERRFIDDFQQIYGSRGRLKAMALPAGMELEDPIKVENDKNQFLSTRQYQRTVIAGGFGVPPHFVGDLTSGTFNNVEQQSLDFIANVVLPVVTTFETAMEKDLLTDSDVTSGVIIRFNLEGALRGDFKSRQDGLKIMRDEGVISANEWREREYMNPISTLDGGDNYIYPANFIVAGKEVDDTGAEDKPSTAMDDNEDNVDSPDEDSDV